MAEQAIEKFDPARLMDGVRDRIKATFVALIPDDEWDKLVHNQINSFFQRQREYSRSEFERICDQELNELVRRKVREVMSTYTTAQWKDNGPVISAELEKVIVANAPELFSAMIGRMMREGLAQIQSSG